MTEKREMNNHVSQPVAQALRDAGWEWETEFIYIKISDKVWPLKHKLLSTKLWLRLNKADWLPAPSIGELRERLTSKNFRDYYDKNIEIDSALPKWKLLGDYIRWLYTVTASADKLAEMWLWAQGQKKGDHNETT